jgi:hypothetical protein
MSHALRRFLLAGGASALLLGGAALTANAAVTDTSFSVSSIRAPYLHVTESVTGTGAGQTLTATGEGSYSPASPDSIEGCAITVTPAGGLTPSGATTSASGSFTVTLAGSGHYQGDAETVTVSFSTSTGCSSGTFAVTGFDTLRLSDPEVSNSPAEVTLSGANEAFSGSGATTFTSTPVTVTSGNLPAGLTDGTSVIGNPGSASQGTYQGVTESASSDGASVSGSFTLAVSTSHVPVPHPAHTYTGTVVNSDGMCLDVRGAFGHASPGDLLQLWSCGAPGTGAGTEDQVFSYTKGQLQYEVNGTGTGYCVTEAATDAQAALETCGSTGTSVTYENGHYQFANGTVLDNAGFHAVNGNRVLTWPYNGGSNQDWSLPQ